MKLKSTRW